MTLAAFYYVLQISGAMILLTWKEEKRKYFLAYLIPLTLLATAIALFFDFRPFGWTNDYFLVGFISVLIIEATAWIASIKGLQKAIFYFVASLALQGGSYNAYRIIYSLIGFDNQIFDHCLHILIISACYLLFYFLLLRRFNEYRDNVIFRKGTVAVTLLVFVINQISELTFGANSTELSSSYWNMISTIITDILALALQFGALWSDVFATEHQKIEALLEKEKEQYRISEENRKLINAKCHDLKQQIAAIKQMKAREDQIKNLGELEEAVMFYDTLLKTGNDALDLIIADKSKLCTDAKIELICVADGEAISFMDQSDIYTLFGNALDNAVEALRKEEESKRRITINIKTKAGLVFIHIENPCSMDISFKDGLPQSNKDNKDYHGYGSKSMRYIANKYDGEMKITLLQGVYSLDFAIPIKE